MNSAAPTRVNTIFQQKPNIEVREADGSGEQEGEVQSLKSNGALLRSVAIRGSHK